MLPPKKGRELVGIDAVALPVGTTAPEAEAAAMFIAGIRALQLALRHPTHICPFWINFHLDCTSAGYTAAGHRWAKTNEKYQSLTRAIIFAIEELHGQGAVEWRHVFGHSGDPLNEAADAASSAAACDWTHSSTLQDWMTLVGQGDEHTKEALHWLWLLCANVSGPLAGPRLGEISQCWWLTAPLREEGLTGQGHSFPRNKATAVHSSQNCFSQCPQAPPSTSGVNVEQARVLEWKSCYVRRRRQIRCSLACCICSLVDAAKETFITGSWKWQLSTFLVWRC